MKKYVNPPMTPGGEVLQELFDEAEHERLVVETEEIHREEAAEEGIVIPMRPWWKVWGQPGRPRHRTAA